MAVTQKQIATQLGISQCVVSYAFNDDPRVTATTRQRVLDVAQQLGYDFAGSREARALIARRYGKRVRSDLVATILPSHHFGGTPAIQIPFYQELLGGIEAEAEARGSAILLVSTHRPDLGSFLSSHNVDGVISLDDEPDLRSLFDTLEAPCCVLGRGSDGVANITSDSRRGIELTTQYLIDLGHQFVGYLGLLEDHYDGRVRAESYRDTMRKNGLIADARWCHTENPGFDECTVATTELLQRAPELTALVCYNDIMAVDAMKLMQQLGIDVPRDVSVAGFDNVRSVFGNAQEITSVAYDRVAMGRRAVQRIYDTVSNDEVDTQREKFPVQLSVHASTAPPRSDRLLELNIP